MFWALRPVLFLVRAWSSVWLWMTSWWKLCFCPFESSLMFPIFGLKNPVLVTISVREEGMCVDIAGGHLQRLPDQLNSCGKGICSSFPVKLRLMRSVLQVQKKKLLLNCFKQWHWPRKVGGGEAQLKQQTPSSEAERCKETTGMGGRKRTVNPRSEEQGEGSWGCQSPNVCVP